MAINQSEKKIIERLKRYQSYGLVLLGMLLVLPWCFVLTPTKAPAIQVVNVDTILQEIYHKTRSLNLKKADEQSFLDEITQELKEDFNHYGKTHNVMLFAKGAVLTDALDVTEVFLR